MNSVASRKRPAKAPGNDCCQLLVGLSDPDKGRLVWSDGTVSSFNPESKLGVTLLAAARKAKRYPSKPITLKGVNVARQWGWHSGRWTVTDIRPAK